MINLAITEQQFNKLYPDLVGLYDHFDKPPVQGISAQEFEQQYLSSKLWRLNNCYTITNKDGRLVTFRMNLSQHKVYAASRKHPRVIILKSRQQGISTLWLVSYFDDCVFCPYLNVGLMAQGTDEAATLLERSKLLWDNLADSVKQFAGVGLDKDNMKEFSFTNNSKIFIRVSFRSATLQRLHCSEFGKIANQYPKRAKETKTGTLQALGRGNTGIIESTAEGRNMFKDMWDQGMRALEGGTMSEKDFYPVFLSWLDDPDCVEKVFQADTKESTKYFDKLEREYGLVPTQEQRNFWIVQYRELGKDIFQEYPATPDEAFSAARDGTFFAKDYNKHVVRGKRIRPGLYDDNLHTDVYFDLGVDDYFVLALVQWYRGEYRIVKEYYNEGMGLEHYIDWLAKSGYEIRDLVFPHDIAVRELGNSDGTGRARSRLDIVRELLRERGLPWGSRALVKTSLESGIEMTRRMIKHMWIDSTCTYLMDCLENYSKQFDEKLNVFTDKPVHDKFSHGADLLRQVAIGTSESTKRNSSKLGNEDNTKRRRSAGYDL
jgi:hypothetical protein